MSRLSWLSWKVSRVFQHLLSVAYQNGQKPHFLTYFLIWLPSIWKNRHTVFTKVVDNDPSNISVKFEASILKTLRKTIFSAYWLQSNREMASKWVKMKFLELGVNRKVVGNVENYLNMKFQPKTFMRFRENVKKKHIFCHISWFDCRQYAKIIIQSLEKL